MRPRVVLLPKLKELSLREGKLPPEATQQVNGEIGTRTKTDPKTCSLENSALGPAWYSRNQGQINVLFIPKQRKNKKQGEGYEVQSHSTSQKQSLGSNPGRVTLYTVLAQ